MSPTNDRDGAGDDGPAGGDAERPVPDGHSFALLLTHDLDRPYKTYQSLYYALTEPARRRYHLSTALPGRNPYWQFGTMMDLEDDLGVRSAVYVLREQRLFRDRPPREWLSMEGWQLFAGRYSLDDPDVLEALSRLDEGGWELGLHGSYESPTDRERLREEKAAVEAAVGHEVLGGRQHYLNLSRPETWEHHRDIGLSYDASLGSSDEYGFQHGYGIQRPFDDGFVVFPLTIMEQALPDPADDFDRAWEACEELLAEARDNGAVMTVLWHPRHFSEGDFPGHRRLYRRLIEHALDLGAWVGPPGELYEREDLHEPPASDGGSAPDPSRSDAPTSGPVESPDPDRSDGRREITNPTGAPDRSE
ncbi:polysaccharide deacetylase family protein [Halorarum halophilum]|uniref:polysaccharide deacetylase family protein n=1 Tax=Halorarum halophilum TaxID=2743090 RepID=UPI0037433E16